MLSKLQLKVNKMVTFAELQQIASDVGHDIDSEVVQFLNAAEALFASRKDVAVDPFKKGFGQNDPVNPVDGTPPSALPAGADTSTTTGGFGGNDPISPALATLANTTPAQTAVDAAPAETAPAEPPVETAPAEPPVETVEPPVETVEAPVETAPAEPPVEIVEAPVETVEAPVETGTVVDTNT